MVALEHALRKRRRERIASTDKDIKDFRIPVPFTVRLDIIKLFSIKSFHIARLLQFFIKISNYSNAFTLQQDISVRLKFNDK